MLDGIITLSQPFFMMMSTIYAGLSYINTTWYVFYTNILNQLMPMEIWTVLFVAQYAIPVIVLTNLGEEEAPHDLKKLGIHSYIVKANLTPRQVVEQVKSAIKAA